MSPPRLTSPSLSLNSSPSSSPPLGPCDSSPASSPIGRTLSLSPPASPGVTDPFAASTKGVRQPRIYEKRDSYGSSYNGTDDGDVLGVSSSRLQPRVPSWSMQDQSDQRVRTASTASNSSTDTWLTPARRASASGLALPDPELDIDLSDEEEDEKKLPVVWKSRAERERALWDGAIELAYQKLDGIVDLQQEGLIGGHGLTSIPLSIAELNNLVILHSTLTPTPSPPKGPPLTYPRERIFSRSQTVPAAHPNHNLPGPTSPRLAKSSSLLNINSHAKSESSVTGLRMYLGNNAIKSLPPVLFTLRNLVLLNLRNNQLTHIPPGIASLTLLRELIIAQNKLTYLPAEMVHMHLDILTVSGNPWIKPPAVFHGSRPVTEASTHFTVPSLTECCLRALVSPYESPHGSASAHTDTVLEALGGISSSATCDYPPDAIRTLKACLPGAVAQLDPQMQASPTKRVRRSSGTLEPEQDVEDDNEADDAPSIGYCKSPVHYGETSAFVRHAVERMSWETVIGGQKITVSGGVPVLWRGCMRGCLGFLDALSTEGGRDGGSE